MIAIADALSCSEIQCTKKEQFDSPSKIITHFRYTNIIFVECNICELVPLEDQRELSKHKYIGYSFILYTDKFMRLLLKSPQKSLDNEVESIFECVIIVFGVKKMCSMYFCKDRVSLFHGNCYL